MRDVLAWLLTAQTWSGEDFCGIAELQWVECAADALHGGQVGFSEHFGHHFLFVFADAVLAGDGAARGDADFEDEIGEGFGGVFLAGDAAVVENHGMEIAVAGMEDVGDAEAGFAAEFFDLGEHARESGAWNDAVLHDVVGRDAGHGGEGGFAAFPEEGALGFGLGDANFGSGVGAADFVDVGHERGDFGDGTVEFDEEKRAAHRIVGVDGGFGGLDGERVHHFDGGGQHAGGDDAADGSAGFVGAGESGKQRLHGFGALDDAENHFCGDAESAFGADENAEEIVAGSVERFSAEVDERAVGENDFEAEDVRGGEAVFQAMRAAGIFRDVAADAARGLRRGIGRVEIALRENARGDVKIDDAGLDGDASVREIDFEDAVHARETDDDAVFYGERAAAEAGAGASRYEGNFFAMAEAKDGLDFGGGVGEKHGAGHGAEIGEGVAFVGVELVGGSDEMAGADDLAEFGEQGGVHGIYRKRILPQSSHGEDMSTSLNGKRVRASGGRFVTDILCWIWGEVLRSRWSLRTEMLHRISGLPRWPLPPLFVSVADKGLTVVTADSRRGRGKEVDPSRVRASSRQFKVGRGGIAIRVVCRRLGDAPTPGVFCQRCG